MGYFDNAMLAVKSTAPLYLKEATDQTIRGRLVMKMLQQSGNIIFNVKTPNMIWQVEVREPKVRAMSAGQKSTFNMADVYEQLEISHAEIEATDALDRRTQMTNANSPQQIIDLATAKMENCIKKLGRTINSQFYTDASGSQAAEMTGIRSFIKSYNRNASDRFQAPDAAVTYGGKSIGVGQFGGTWSALLGAVPARPNTFLANDWPEGQGSSEYDWNSPKIIQYDGDWTPAVTDSWVLNATKLVRRASTTLKNLGGDGVEPIVNLFAKDMYDAFFDNLETRERLYVSDYAKELGFPDLLNYQGSIITTDFDCPAGRGFAINPNEMALYSVHDSLFFTEGPVWTTPEQRTLFLCGFLGNWRWNVKHVCAYVPYTA